MSRDNWDDLRFVLAVVDEGSVSGAARRLGVNHATVLRRVAAFEEATGTELFDKTARGYVVPPDRMPIVDAAREVDRAVQSVSRLLAGARAPLTGDVRITSTDSLCQILLPPIIASISREAPEVRVQLLSSNAHMDLGRIQADITVRPTDKLPDDLVGSRAAELAFGLYHLSSESPDKLAWLGLVGQLSRTVPSRWMADSLSDSDITDGADSFMTLRELALQGRGLAILPRFLGDSDPRLSRIIGMMPPLSVDIWVASHVDLAGVPRIALMRRLLTEAIARSLPVAGEPAH
jgi:DNA-binding transcriptional LysR family regulator